MNASADVLVAVFGSGPHTKQICSGNAPDGLSGDTLFECQLNCYREDCFSRVFSFFSKRTLE
jgi:hypothetical protein